MQIFGEIPFINPQNDKQQLNGKKWWKMTEKDLFGFSFYSLFSAWKIVDMTMVCNWCDVMNIMWRKTEMEQKSDRERWGDGGGGGGGGRNKERERELSFGIWIYGGGGGGEQKKQQLVLDPTLEKEGFQFQTENQSTQGKNPH